MTDRRLHPAPPDYGIVEIREAEKPPRFLVYHRGSEIARCTSLDQALSLTDSHRQRVAEGREFSPNDSRASHPVGCP